MEWHGAVVGVVCLVVTALVSRWVRRLVERRSARKREATAPLASRQVRRAQARKRG